MLHWKMIGNIVLYVEWLYGTTEVQKCPQKNADCLFISAECNPFYGWYNEPNFWPIIWSGGGNKGLLS